MLWSPVVAAAADGVAEQSTKSPIVSARLKVSFPCRNETGWHARPLSSREYVQLVDRDRTVGDRASADERVSIRVAIDRRKKNLGDPLAEIRNRIVGELAGRRQQVDAEDVVHDLPLLL